MRRSTEGFTLLEVLVAILLFSVIILVVTASLTGFFGLSTRTTQQVDTTTRAQALMEEIRGQWQTQTAYDLACVQLTQPSNTAVVVRDENADGSAVNALTYAPVFSANCVSATAPAAMTVSTLRQVSVTATSTTAGGSSSTLVLEIPRP